MTIHHLCLIIYLYMEIIALVIHAFLINIKAIHYYMKIDMSVLKCISREDILNFFCLIALR